MKEMNQGGGIGAVLQTGSILEEDCHLKHVQAFEVNVDLDISIMVSITKEENRTYDSLTEGLLTV